MRHLELGTFAEVFNGKTPSKAEQRSSGLPILKIRDMDEFGGFRDNYGSFVDQTFYDRYSKKILETGDTIVLNAAHNSNYVGNKNAQISNDVAGVIATGEWLIIRPKSVFSDYVNHFIKSPEGKKRLKARVKGIHLYPKDVARIKIPVPEEYDDQIRISHLLGKVEWLIAQRKQSLQQLDDLLKSVFLDMFGDPVRNEKGWDKKPFEKLLSNIDSGWSPKCEARKANQDEWGILKLGAVTSCNYLESENKALPDVPDSKRHHEIKSGDLLFSRKNTYALVAACAYVFETRPKLLMPDLIFRFVLKDNKEVNPLYLWKLLMSDSQRRKIQSLAAGAAGSMPNISKTNLKQVLLPIPPIDLQNKFAAIIEKVEGIKGCYQLNLSELENLYGALSQKAFKDELDLSRILVPGVEPETEDISDLRALLSNPEEMRKQVLEQVNAAPNLSSSEGRKKFLRLRFDVFIQKKASNGALLLEAFWSEVEYESLDSMDEDIEPFGIDEYDWVKDWVFELLESGKLMQQFDDTQNKVVLRVQG